ncbi:hypothetical protein HN020_14835 [Brevibacillus borstelensis]|uniref:hypothetical protein n=1 Tax=Brevibacillus borstelensis TaxID=45462 RepID=UPI00046A0778|nr:hypothetical protein [Brevibacillus borstelensis]MCC0567576.1 hypothetical protein [Brevibacillus borstelensis]MCM3561564.1 hypothetical protein [Brevibacillus borstelensis]MCM3594091.1 hypothetical protein [Brevibacillus borstelensis]NOU56019.1 hypothetical protein [Brevibacillus borstelensis]
MNSYPKKLLVPDIFTIVQSYMFAIIAGLVGSKVTSIDTRENLEIEFLTDLRFFYLFQENEFLNQLGKKMNGFLNRNDEYSFTYEKCLIIRQFALLLELLNHRVILMFLKN